MKITVSEYNPLLFGKEAKDNRKKNIAIPNENTDLNFKLDISEEGKKLARQLNTDTTSASSEELADINKKKKYQSECKERINELDKILSRDDITDEEREKISTERESLLKNSRNSEDALYEAYKQKDDFNNSHNLEECTDDDVKIIEQVNVELNKIIKERKDVLSRENEHIQSLQDKQIQENGDIALEKQKNKQNESEPKADDNDSAPVNGSWKEMDILLSPDDSASPAPSEYGGTRSTGSGNEIGRLSRH